MIFIKQLLAAKLYIFAEKEPQNEKNSLRVFPISFGEKKVNVLNQPF